ncbi:pyruvoyl-dependent arginine decarboxylase [Halodesulfurarchaeum sp.]|uniref:pyruvoyl-dependent arginine decarboxylase n=1 Tax=Halodesulfurarchaeum sp. TaxID=1980530 RepID=UPI001BC4C3D8|nr:pyruvoyl-dependent arginine decarboxylase [Halodesulfurarchaeum sp.]
MGTIQVVWGTGRGPTETAAYDAALAAANVHNYNLVTVSSVIPADSTVTQVGTAPDLGPIGQRLTVVQGKATVAGPGVASAGLAWTTGEGPGLFYESSGPSDAKTVEMRATEGIEAGLALRDWSTDSIETETASTEAASGEYASAVVLAVYGTAEPIL